MRGKLLEVNNVGPQNGTRADVKYVDVATWGNSVGGNVGEGSSIKDGGKA